MATSDASNAARRTFRLVYDVVEAPERWLLDEDDMPETPEHDQTLTLLRALLQAWVLREGRSARVARNLACRWDPSDKRVGVDPDVCVIEPDQPSIDELGQLQLWRPGHVAPRVAFEVVSESTASKDYLEVGGRYARLGTQEVWVFDPHLYGPRSDLGPCILSGWRRRGDDMVRVHAGNAPAYSEQLEAWLVTTHGGTRLRFAEDPGGERLWPLPEEAERQRAEQAEAEVARLRALLAERE